ncbi:hypothetical protein ACVH9Z_25160 [Rhodococcus opacus]|uniref:hypothetical protein n=1 Tax=Rhodococcus opacus TaxID=37919 RepID=UPI00146E4AAA|nr:hypothetical protein [Rhodococcus opacus]MDJ0419607.1 hypothetical protein [Rhodococcus opacus]MDV7088231.1 hypothetical protein [Rhodococcus opacus]WKN52597.1 hypothetical protein HJ581_0001370 [Rhodococcus opacus]
MTLSHRRPRRTAAAAALAVGAITALTACGSDEGRKATAVSASTSAVIVTDASTDLGSIIIGWGEDHSDTEITTPRPDQLDARCYGSADALAIDITTPHGWKIHARSGSQILAIENIDQDLARTDVDATNKYLDITQSIDWSQPDEVDIAATADAPQGWNSPAGPARVCLSFHIDCR